jgi:hypothetical protein
MKFSKRVNYALLGFLIMLNITFRYPTTPHELGADSFYLHMIANSVSHYGYATWIVHPFSFFGLTPETSPTAYPYILSGLSQLSGLDMEYTILLFSTMVGLIGFFNCFLMAKEIKNDDRFIFFVIFMFSISPIFLNYTIWTVTGRNLFLAMFPLFIWSVFKNINQAKMEYKYIFLSIIIFIILFSIHRMTLLIISFIIAFIISLILYKKLTKISLPQKVWMLTPIAWIGIFLIFLIAQLFNWGIYSELNTSWMYKEGYLFKGGELIDRILNMGVDYASKYGFLFFFGVIAILNMLFFSKKFHNIFTTKIKINRNYNRIFFPILILCYSPWILLGVYTSLILLPFICLISGFGVIYILDWSSNIKKIKIRNILNKALPVTIIIFLILSIAFTMFMTQLWRRPIAPADDTRWMSEETYDTAMYLNEFSNDSNYILNDWVLGGRLYASSDKRLYMKLNLSRVTIERGSVLDLYYSDTLYIITSHEYSSNTNIHGLNFGEDTQRLKILMSQNDIKFAVEKNNIPEGQYMSYGGNLRHSAFYESMFQERYKVYDNGYVSLWNVD